MVVDETNAALLVPQYLVKEVKTSLEKYGRINRSLKIHQRFIEEGGTTTSRYFLVPIILGDDNPSDGPDPTTFSQDRKEEFLKSIGLAEHIKKLSFGIIQDPHTRVSNTRSKGNPLLATVEEWLQELPPSLLQPAGLNRDTLLSTIPTTYSVYKPLLLLPPVKDLSSEWSALFSTLESHLDLLASFYQHLCAAFNVTHIAFNAPIPLHNAQGAGPSPTTNVLRSPLHLTPIHGDFGPSPLSNPSLSSSPTPTDFSTAFWVSTRQNGIHQIWAPLYTMFSRGNISEKARLLTLPSVKASQGCTAVDLYAGIGYFAFSYKKAGLAKILCWELNPWSVEGLLRGAEKNRWVARLFDDSEGLVHEPTLGFAASSFVVFRESNERALERIGRLRGAVPPIRHVNCGLLPRSRASWGIAVRTIDPAMGGWVHVHENIAVGDIEEKSGEIAGEIQDIVKGVLEQQGRERSEETTVRLEHVERVKTYAPGVMHCVLDFHIPPLGK